MDNITDFRDEGFDEQKLFRLSTRAESRMLDLSFTKNLVVSDVGYYPRAQGHLVNRKVGTNAHILIFCLSGQGWFKLKGKRRSVSAMEVFWIPPSEIHSYGSHRTDPWEIYWVHAYGEQIEALLEWTSLTADRPIATFSNTLALSRQFNALIQRLELGYTDHTLLELSQFFVRLVSLLHIDTGTEKEMEQKENIENAMETMRQTISAPLSLSEYASGVGLSVSQFSHLFKRHYGTSPMAYFTELRMQRATELLDNTHLSIKEISWKLGFEDQLYFSRLFKKISGVSPSAYRLDKG